MPAAALAPKNTSNGPSSIASLSRTDGAGSAGIFASAAFAGASALRSGCGFILVLHAGDGAREVVRVERLEIVDPLADADGVDRQFEALGDGHQNAAARRSVELGHDEAGDARDLLEDFHLIERILARGCVEHEDHAV